MIRLTIEHPMSSYGIPVFVGRGNRVMDYADGVRKLRRERGWSVADVAARAGVSPRTIEGWEQGRLPSAKALLRLMAALQ